MSHHYGAELHLCGVGPESWRNTPLVFLATTYQILRHRLRNRCFPQLIPPGGSSHLGAIGFINAAFELKEQVVNGEMPEPDCLYVASGTMGTAAGLILGLRAANLKSRVISVRVTDDKFVNANGMIKLIDNTNSLLCSLDASFPRIELSEEDIDIRHSYFGQQYALFTKEGMEAVARMEKSEGINLDGTYTGKAFAAVIDDGKNENLRDKVVLFWNTLNSRDFSDAISAIDYRSLPQCFHRYFEEEVQPLDRDH